MSFADLKKNRNKKLADLTEKLNQSTAKGYSDPDADKYWMLKRDAAGNGSAIIRFLDAPDGEEVPFVKLWSHGFKGPTGQWYIENSLTTLGQDDPVSAFNTKLWNASTDDKGLEREQARAQKRKTHFISNILVIKDSATPENEGKVFLFKYGKKVFDKIKDVMNPSFEDEEPINPFDLFEGVNFKFRMRQVEGYANYDKSEFETTKTPIADSDKEIEAIWKQCHSLQAVIAPDKFKSYEELEAKLHRVLGITEVSEKRKAAPATIEDDEDEDLNVSKTMKEKTPPTVKEETKTEVVSSDDEDEDDLEFFRKLAEKN